MPNWTDINQGRWQGIDQLSKEFMQTQAAEADRQAAEKRQQVQQQFEAAQKQKEQEQANENTKSALGEYLAGTYGKPGEVGITLGPTGNIHGITPKSSTEDLLRLLSIKNLQDERESRHEEALRNAVQQAGTAQAVPALKRGEEAIPGLFTGDQPVDLKSMGGLKNMVPNMAVPAMEKMGLMPKGSGAERTALQDLANTKIYDSSGKQINEKEMQRIQTAMGMSGVFEPTEIVRALRQMGYTTLEKQKQATAGAPPSAVKAMKSRGGLVGAQTLSELLGMQPKAAPAQAPSGAPAPGTVMNGYLFKGGDPSQQSNWEKQ